MSVEIRITIITAIVVIIVIAIVAAEGERNGNEIAHQFLMEYLFI